MREFTDVMLDKSLVDGQESSRSLLGDESGSRIKQYYPDATDSSVTKYVLRQLRPGYFYILDDAATAPFNWFAYVVKADGMFYQFSINDVPPTPENAEFDCGGAPEEEKSFKALNASLIALPTVENEGKLYYAFTEHPWSEAHLNKLRTTPELRDRVMQEIDLKSWVDGNDLPYAYGVEDLSLVAEYSDGAAGMELQFWPTQPDRRLFSREDMQQAMDTRLSRASDRYQGRGLILAVKDELGIIEELNGYRQQPLEIMKEFLGEDGSDNRRQLTVMHAVDAFKENFRNSYLDSTAPSEDTVEYLENQDAAYESGLANIEEKINEARASGDENALARYQREKEWYLEQNAWLNNRLERQTEARTSHADVKLADFVREMGDHYDQERLALFRNGGPDDDWGGYNGRADVIQKLITALDEDYAFWVLEHLASAAERYSQQDADYYYGLGLSGLVSSALSGGIYSSASVYLWSELAKALDTETSPLGRALFGNMSNLHAHALQDRQSLSDKAFFDEAKLKEWQSEFISLRSSVENVSENSLEERYQESVSSLIETLAGSFSALAMGETALEAMKATSEGGEASASSRKNGEVALQSLTRYLQLMTMGQADMFTDGAELPIIERLTLKKQDYYTWLESLPRQIDAVRRGHPRPDESGAMHYSDGSGGNFSLNTLDGDGTLEVIVPASMSLGFLDVNRSSDDDADSNQSNKYLGITKSGTKLASDVLDAMKVRAVTASSLALVSAVIALGQEWSKTGDNNDNLKIFGAFIAFSGASMGLTKAIVERRNQAVAGSGAAAWGFTSSRQWVVTAQGAKYAGVFFSLYEAGNKLSAAETARKRGVPIEVTGSYIQASFSLIGIAVGFLATWPALLGGLALALLGGYFANAYKALVPLACSTWLNRCFLRLVVGNSGRGLGQIEPFDDSNHEVRSLDMVFAGLTVSLLWEDTVMGEDSNLMPHMRPNTGTGSIASGYPVIAIQEQGGNFNAKKIKIEVTVPDLESMELDIALTTGGGLGGGELFSYSYKKDDGERELVPDRNSTSNRSEMGRISRNSEGYKLSMEKSYGYGDIIDFASFEVRFRSVFYGHEEKNDAFILRLEK
ncbi:hypothetical protein AR456_06750 [Halomonas huangheensis]|nr:hypothetical protein AR456_06750 [Halomonas huangheensis]